jgi:hypothetical protein
MGQINTKMASKLAHFGFLFLCHFSSLPPFVYMLLLQVCENHPEGVILVKYKDRKDGLKCIEAMNGRW